ncbi:mechanosensitive ion channel family protein [Flavilitoribacter nigricans]|uniref:Mechanosensitive ion channel protein MscS n=1 Tax=Flavilitoribacter nigricans (strain ATCC 23147 / DSM 23189 / NBRC 102662 / NCIMB 1420 / SS-2) TaxID=1122177 RepID=A0A2D0N952_FLAN2|nr:mechanosensitive ion channel domain-containing protein [Flavilitoribacter nigricans]PHN05051.1 mechanosensitive ion channel protein MscS [Flavilitoribacter nigricans DSM 23189 = NBRC 102662]
MEQLIADVKTQIISYYDQLVSLLPKMIFSVLVLLLTFYLARKISRFGKTQLNLRMEDPLLAQFFARVIRWLVIVIGFLVILRIVGLGAAAASLLAGAGITAFIIGFAFKDIGENFLAGILMAFKRPFRIGDIVETGGITGVIKGLSLRDTHMKTFDGKDVYVPNGQIMKNPIFNYTIDGFMRLDFTIGLDYGSDLDKATRIIYETLEHIHGILWDEGKDPNVVISSLGSSTINITVYFWIDTFDKTVSSLAVKTNAIRETVQALTKGGIQMPSDIMELKTYNDMPIPMVNRLDKQDSAA